MQSPRNRRNIFWIESYGFLINVNWTFNVLPLLNFLVETKAIMFKMIFDYFKNIKHLTFIQMYHFEEMLGTM